MKKLLPLLVVLAFLLPQGQAHATAYYIDYVNGSDSNAGTATTSAWMSLTKFMNAARSAGDIAFVRRGLATTTNIVNLTLTSSGTLVNPIVTEADYDNLWGDFATSSETYTVTPGSVYMAASASSTQVGVGKWIYVYGDCFETYSASTYNACQYAYEVMAASSTGIQLYIPYKGNQSGSGLAVRVMPSAPQWGTSGGSNQILPNTKRFWVFKGLNFSSGAANGIFESVAGSGWYFMDDDFFGSGNRGINLGDSATDQAVAIAVYKTRFSSVANGDIASTARTSVLPISYVRDSYMPDGFLFQGGDFAGMNFYDTTLYGLLRLGATIGGSTSNLYFRNTNISGADASGGLTTTAFSSMNFQDAGNIIGRNLQVNALKGSNTNPIASSTNSSTFIRSGGGPVSEQILPSANNNNILPFSQQLLFEYPIYADASSKTYSMYFMSTSTSAWTANPTAQQMWIECEYWNFPSGATSTRVTKTSTGTLNFTGSTAWQNLSVTCQPSTSGILYLRGWYGKTLEGGGKMNEFYMDTTPVIQ